MTTPTKNAPNSKESEMMVLGCMLTSVNGLNIAADSLDDSDFYYNEHKIIFGILKAAYKNDKPGDVLLVAEELKRQDKLKIVGGVAYITTLAQYAGTSAHIEEYASIVKDKAMLRSMINAASNLEKAALHPEASALELILEAQERFKEIEIHGSHEDKFPIEFLKVHSIIKKPPAKPMLLNCSIFDEKGNEITRRGYLPRGIVAMIVGAGGVGKTHLLAQLAISVATGMPWLNQHHPIKKGNVFLGLGENNDEDIRRLLYKASKKIRPPKSPMIEQLTLDLPGNPIEIPIDNPLQDLKRIAPFSFCGQQAACIENGKPSQYFRKLKMKLIKIAPEDGWDLLIFDPISRLMGADAETDNAAATQFIALMEELALDLPGNPTVLLAHHKSKQAMMSEAKNEQNQSAARGSSALTDAVRWQIDLAKTKDGASLKITKSNFTAIPDVTYLTKESDGYIVNATTSQDTTKVPPAQKTTSNPYANIR